MKKVIAVIESLIGLAFLMAGYGFYTNIDKLYKTLSMPQSEQVTYQLMILLCVGFGCLMLKRR